MIPVARISGSYGVRGWLTVEGETGLLGMLRSWWVGGEERSVEQSRGHSGRLLAKLSGVETREQARLLKGMAVRVPRSALPPPAPGTYYWDDLVGLEVVNAEGRRLGTVQGLFSNGAHDVMRLGDGTTERLVPFVPSVVKGVDLEARRIEVDWGTDW